jgi:hypothetical protein
MKVSGGGTPPPPVVRQKKYDYVNLQGCFRDSGLGFDPLQGQEGILHADLIIQAALCGDF